MKCPFCGNDNISGTDECESCHGDLASLDGVVPRTKIEKVLMRDLISKLEPRKAMTVQGETTVLEAVHKMNEAKVGCVLIEKNGRLDGIVTERDVVFKVLSRTADLSKVTTAEIMTRSPDSLTEDDTLAYAVNKMSVGGFRHIPIVKKEKPVGIISVRDVLRYLSQLFGG